MRSNSSTARGGPCSTGAGRRGATSRPARAGPCRRPPGRGSRRASSGPRRRRQRSRSGGTVLVTATSVTSAGIRPARRAASAIRARTVARARSNAATSPGSDVGRCPVGPATGRLLPAEEAGDLQVVGVVGRGGSLSRGRLPDRSFDARGARPGPRSRRRPVRRRDTPNRRRPRRAGARAPRGSRARAAGAASRTCP